MKLVIVLSALGVFLYAFGLAGGPDVVGPAWRPAAKVLGVVGATVFVVGFIWHLCRQWGTSCPTEPESYDNSN